MIAISRLTMSGILSLLFILAATACSGRTTENMHPTGETVEVAIDTIGAVAPVVADTLGNSDKTTF